MTAEEVVALFPEGRLFNATFRRPDGDVWVRNEPVSRPYIPAQYAGSEKQIIRIPSTGWQEFYLDFPVEDVDVWEDCLTLYGEKGSATFDFS